MNELHKKTYQDIMALEPCYDPAERGLCTPAWEGTALDVLKAENVSAEDKFWVVCHEGWIPDTNLREFARWCALQVINMWDAPAVVREYLETGNENLRDAARDAAWAAARDAAWAAARDAARDAQIKKLIELLGHEDA